MSRDLIERLRAPDRHDPACPFKKHCYCDDGAPHDSVQHPHALEAADEIERLRAELSSLRGEGVMLVDQAWLDRRQAEPDAIVEAGAPIRLHVMPGDPPHLMQTTLQWYLKFEFAFPHTLRESNIAAEAFKDGYRACLAERPTPDSDVIGRLVEIVNDTQSTLSAVKAEATVDGGGTCIWIAETLHAQMLTNAAALASIPSTEGSTS